MMEDRRYDIALHTCIDPECKGDLVEREYREMNNWITAVYECTQCGKIFTLKIEA